MTEERFSVESDFQWRRRIIPLLCPLTCTDEDSQKSCAVLSGRKILMTYKIVVGTWTHAKEPVKLQGMKGAFMVLVKYH